MTVKCLPEIVKDYIVSAIVTKSMTINELTDTFDCSRRTVVRVLIERGIDPQLRKRKVKVKLAPMPSVDELSGFPTPPASWMEKTVLPPRPTPTPYGFDTHGIGKVEMIEPQPWWKRLGQAVSRVFS